jgi:uncharacterized protein
MIEQQVSPRENVTSQRAINRLDVVVKVAERCNLACTYCYFFKDGSDYKHHPSRMSMETWHQAVAFLKKGVRDCRVSVLKIVFHGGEPTLVGASAFDKMCEHLRMELSDLVALDIGIQTNGTLISPAWIRVFKKHAVAVGVSLDGPKEYNDLHRIDHKGNGSHEAVTAGISQLMAAANKGELEFPGALFVVNSEFDPKYIFRHLVDELGFKAFDALLPDKTEVLEPSRYGEFLAGLFDEWVERRDSDIYIRTFRALLDRFAGMGSYQFPLDPELDDFLALTISSDGGLRPDDVIPDSRWQDAHCSNAELRSFSNHPLYLDWIDAASRIPKECEGCCWANLCRGGHPWHRYAADGRGYDRRSVYCSGLKILYAHVCAFMLNNGYALPLMLEQLGLTEERLAAGTENAEH